MTRRRLLSSALALPVVPTLIALPTKPKKHQKKFEVTIAFESDPTKVAPEKREVLFDMKYSVGDTPNPWRLIGRSFLRFDGQRQYTCVTAKYGIPVYEMSEEIARWAGYAMSVYFLSEGERPVGKRYTYTIREEKMKPPA